MVHDHDVCHDLVPMEAREHLCEKERCNFEYCKHDAIDTAMGLVSVIVEAGVFPDRSEFSVCLGQC